MHFRPSLERKREGKEQGRKVEGASSQADHLFPSFPLLLPSLFLGPSSLSHPSFALNQISTRTSLDPSLSRTRTTLLLIVKLDLSNEEEEEEESRIPVSFLTSPEFDEELLLHLKVRTTDTERILRNEEFSNPTSSDQESRISSTSSPLKERRLSQVSCPLGS